MFLSPYDSILCTLAAITRAAQELKVASMASTAMFDGKNVVDFQFLVLLSAPGAFAILFVRQKGDVVARAFSSILKFACAAVGLGCAAKLSGALWIIYFPIAKQFAEFLRIFVPLLAAVFAQPLSVFLRPLLVVSRDTISTSLRRFFNLFAVFFRVSFAPSLRGVSALLHAFRIFSYLTQFVFGGLVWIIRNPLTRYFIATRNTPSAIRISLRNMPVFARLAREISKQASGLSIGFGNIFHLILTNLDRSLQNAA